MKWKGNGISALLPLWETWKSSGEYYNSKTNQKFSLQAAQALIYDLVPFLFTMAGFATISEYTFFFFCLKTIYLFIFCFKKKDSVCP